MARSKKQFVDQALEGINLIEVERIVIYLTGHSRQDIEVALQGKTDYERRAWCKARIRIAMENSLIGNDEVLSLTGFLRVSYRDEREINEGWEVSNVVSA